MRVRVRVKVRVRARSRVRDQIRAKVYMSQEADKEVKRVISGDFEDDQDAVHHFGREFYGTPESNEGLEDFLNISDIRNGFYII